MKTVITCSDNNIRAPYDKRFGRAAWFCVFDDVSKETVFKENTNYNDSSGAGTKAVEVMVKLNIQKVISGDFGLKAKELLDTYNIQMVIIPDNTITIKEIIDRIK